MRREIAEKIVSAVKEIDNSVDKIDKLTAFIQDNDTEIIFKNALFYTVTKLHEDIVLNIVKEFPDLHPDKDEI